MNQTAVSATKRGEILGRVYALLLGWPDEHASDAESATATNQYPDSASQERPTQKPDWSNYRYFIENLLQEIVYRDDCMVLGPLPGDKMWADDYHPPGVMIEIERIVD